MWKHIGLFQNNTFLKTFIIFCLFLKQGAAFELASVPSTLVGGKPLRGIAKAEDNILLAFNSCLAEYQGAGKSLL